MSTESKNTPMTLSNVQRRMVRQIELCRDTYEGPLQIQDQKQKYLPQFPRESPSAYRDRLEASVFYDAFSRTVNGLTGLVYRDPVKLADNMPEVIKRVWEDVDLQGTHAEVFCQSRHIDGEIDGLFMIFIDMPEHNDEVKVKADEKDRRPYWIPITASNLVCGEVEYREGRMLTTHLRFKEMRTRREGYKQIEELFVREYNLVEDDDGRFVEFAIHKQDANNSDRWIIDESGWMDIDEIPLSIGYIGGKIGPFESRPPHYALARENIKHYQLTSDNDNVLHLTCVPIYVRIGYVRPVGSPDESVGPTVGIDLPLNGDAKYVEPQGTGLNAMEKRIEKSEYRMAILGLSMLMSERRGMETATSKRINKSESDSALSNHARASQDAFEEAVRFTAKWMDVLDAMPARDDQSRWVTVNKNFEDLTLDPQIVGILAGLVEKNKLTQETLWKVLLRGKVLPETFSPDEEARLLEERGMREIQRAMEQMKAQAAANKESGAESDEEDDDDSDEGGVGARQGGAFGAAQG